MQILNYQSGFANHFSTEAIPGSLPIGQNSPQQAPLGLYAEQLSGSAFTAPRSENRRSWLYRIRPSVCHGHFSPMPHPAILPATWANVSLTPNQLRWSAPSFPSSPIDWLSSLFPFALHGDGQTHGASIYLYACNQSMENTFLYSADGEFLIVPQQGSLLLATELGQLLVTPGEIAVLPRGMKFQVELLDDEARGYVLENHGEPLRLPDLGPIGANGLANSRDFQTPVAHYQDKEGDYYLVAKLAQSLWQAKLDHHPLDVVAWHGNYAPYKYDLSLFNTINTVSFDHADPSIFTVLTSPSSQAGTANIDFVIFPERWMVAEHSFRPPYFHRNLMSEFMGLIAGQYDAKGEGFAPGGASLHNVMSAHGPDTESFAKASAAALQPAYLSGTLAFMFESRLPWQVTAGAMQAETLQNDYQACWQGLTKHFAG